LNKLIEGFTEVKLRVGQVTPELLEGLRHWSNEIAVDGQRITLVVQDDEALPALAQWIVEQNVGLYALSPQTLSLEELFMRVVENDQ
jgi:hypothetical protein